MSEIKVLKQPATFITDCPRCLAQLEYKFTDCEYVKSYKNRYAGYKYVIKCPCCGTYIDHRNIDGSPY